MYICFESFNEKYMSKVFVCVINHSEEKGSEAKREDGHSDLDERSIIAI